MFPTLQEEIVAEFAPLALAEDPTPRKRQRKSELPPEDFDPADFDRLAEAARRALQKDAAKRAVRWKLGPTAWRTPEQRKAKRNATQRAWRASKAAERPAPLPREPKPPRRRTPEQLRAQREKRKAEREARGARPRADLSGWTPEERRARRAAQKRALRAATAKPVAHPTPEERKEKRAAVAREARKLLAQPRELSCKPSAIRMRRLLERRRACAA